MATDKIRYKDVKVRIPEEELAVLNCRVAKTGMSREQYIRCLIADTIPAEYPPACSHEVPKTSVRSQSWIPSKDHALL